MAHVNDASTTISIAVLAFQGQTKIPIEGLFRIAFGVLKTTAYLVCSSCSSQPPTAHLDLRYNRPEALQPHKVLSCLHEYYLRRI